MFNYIKGELVEIRASQIVLENNGIGYELFVSNFATQSLEEELNREIKIYTYFQVRDDGVSLFGFYSEEEKEMFLNLITVAGLGPKGAINILSNTSPTDLSVIIASGDVGALSKIKGVGKKTAERLITELKDKVEVISSDYNKTSTSASNSEIEDAIVVLISLGLTKQEASSRAHMVIEAGDKAEDIIRKSLISS